MALVDDAQFRSARASLEAVFSSMVTRYMAAEESDVEAFVARDVSASLVSFTQLESTEEVQEEEGEEEEEGATSDARFESAARFGAAARFGL